VNGPDSISLSGVMVEFAERNSDLTGKIDQRYREGTEGNHEQAGHPEFMPNLEQRTCKGKDDKHRYRNTADHGPEDGPVQHHRTAHEPRKIRLEPGSRGIVVGDRV